MKDICTRERGVSCFGPEWTDNLILMIHTHVTMNFQTLLQCMIKTLPLVSKTGPHMTGQEIRVLVNHWIKKIGEIDIQKKMGINKEENKMTRGTHLKHNRTWWSRHQVDICTPQEWSHYNGCYLQELLETESQRVILQ